MATLRRLTLPLGVVAALLLIYLENPWVQPDGDLRNIVTWAFWIASIVLVIGLFEARKDPDAKEVEIEAPATARFLLSNSRAGLLWLPIRLFVGFEFLAAGLHKFGDPAWFGGSGTALLGYWTKAVAVDPTTAKGPITFEWYRDFLNLLINNHTAGWFAQFITLGEIAVGLGLIVGLFTGLAAFFGALMNMSFLLAGSGSSNPVMFTLGVGLILAWKVAGYYGLDRYVLPRLGTPWKPGALFLQGRGSEPGST